MSEVDKRNSADGIVVPVIEETVEVNKKEIITGGIRFRSLRMNGAKSLIKHSHVEMWT